MFTRGDLYTVVFLNGALYACMLNASGAHLVNNCNHMTDFCMKLMRGRERPILD
jgi:hypothetical protein